MIRTTGIRLAALTLGAVAAACLVGCGNGVEVRGPADSPAPAVTPAQPSPTPEKTPDGSPSPTQHATHEGHHEPPAQQTSHTPKPPPAPKTSAPTETSAPHQTATPDQPKPHKSPTSSAPTRRAGLQYPAGESLAECQFSDLKLDVEVPAGGGAAGSQYVLIRFTNVSQKPCGMYGYAGVSFVGHQDGTQLGPAAERDRSRSMEVVRIRPGRTKSELVQIAEAGNFDAKECQPTTSDGFRIYPPDSYSAAYVPFKTQACQGSTQQLTVYPVGSN